MGQRPTESEGFIHDKENMCRVSTRRDRSPGDPIYFGDSFPYLPNPITPLLGITFKKS